MATKAKRVNFMKVTLWTETMRADFEGPLSACIADSIMYVSDREKRERILKRMTETHQKMCRREDEANRPKPPEHDLYRTGDEGAPDAIKDRNGEVVLNLCRCCGKGEAELIDTPCPGPKEGGA
ncbi:putative pyrophosphatase [Pseudomonas phage vB_Pa-PAC6]